MKKFITIALILVTIISLCSCGTKLPAQIRESDYNYNFEQRTPKFYIDERTTKSYHSWNFQLKLREAVEEEGKEVWHDFITVGKDNGKTTLFYYCETYDNLFFFYPVSGAVADEFCVYLLFGDDDNEYFDTDVHAVVYDEHCIEVRR